jgi:probable HAF family extracellular repeat protein
MVFNEVTGINNNGQVVGWGMTNDGLVHAFRTEANQPINPATDDLGTLGGPVSYACGINDSGQVAGWSETNEGIAHAFIYKDGKMQDLNDLIDPESAWTLQRAYAINNSGQIVGCNDVGGAFLLTPIPEPSTIALLFAGGVCLLAFAWRRHRAV